MKIDKEKALFALAVAIVTFYLGYILGSQHMFKTGVREFLNQACFRTPAK